MIRRTFAIAVKEFLQLQRDWRTTATLLGMPVVLLMIYGFALSFDVKDVRLAVVDSSHSEASRDLIQAFLSCGTFKLVASPPDERPLDALFDDGTAQAALVIPPDFDAQIHGSRPSPVQFVLDGSDSQTGNTILGYARQIALVSGVRLYGPQAMPPITLEPRVWYNPDLNSTIFLVPGLLAFILMITSVIATALAVVREKERGTMESLRATPLQAIEVLVGKTLPYLVLASIAAAGALTLAWGLFDVPIRGSLSCLALATVLFLAGGLGWGLLISTLADTQQVAFQMGLLTSMLPTLLLSGFIFPIASMPKALQIISIIVPARYFIDALRSIVLKGAGLHVWLLDAGALVIFAVVLLMIATARMVRRL